MATMLRRSIHEARDGRQGLNILCLDGGGVRGLSSLMLVSEMMRQIQRVEGHENPPSPCDYFDVIAGAGTGAVIACFLGRLKLPIDKATSLYCRLVKDVFSHKKQFSSSGSGTFKLSKLKETLTMIIQDVTGNKDEPMMRQKIDTSMCNTMVFAMSRQHVSGSTPTIFRTYESLINPGPDCLIWEALCATMAHPDLFKSVDIGEPPVQQSFVGGGLGCNNPISHVLSETKVLYPTRNVASVVSIGAGHASTIEIPKSSSPWSLPANAIKAMKDLATDSEREAQDMAIRFCDTGVYFRFDVDQGLQKIELSEWERLGEIAAHTQAYTRKVEVHRRVQQAAQTIKERNPTIPVAQIDGQILSLLGPIVPDRCPAPTPVFTGRKKKIQQVRGCLVADVPERRVCVIHGLGGAGKTQLALKVIESTREKWAEILYVDASSREAVESAFRSFALAKKIGKTHEDAIRWLGSGRKGWLLVFDNADLPSLDIHEFFPGGDHGSILVTTQLSDMAILSQGPGSRCFLSGMDTEDALELLFRLARLQVSSLSDHEIKSAEDLLLDFGYLTLAIVHAGAYIGYCHNMSVSKYRRLFLARQPTLGMFDEYAKVRFKVDHYSKTVNTTWELCYDLLGPLARTLFWLIAFFHFDLITEDIFRRAASRIRLYQHIIPLNQIEANAHAFVRQTLDNFTDSDGSWNTVTFSTAINEISSCSLLEYDQTNQAYRMHALVQIWARTTSPHPPDLAIECATTLLSMSIDLNNTSKSHAFRRLTGQHVHTLLSLRQKPVGADHAAHFARVYFERGQWHDSEKLESQVRVAREAILGIGDTNTLTTLNNIACIYQCQGYSDEAEVLHKQVLDTRIQMLGEQAPGTLESMDNLATVFWNQGQWNKAEKLYAQVLGTRIQVLGPEAQDTLVSMCNLAYTFVEQGRWDDAEKLHAKVLDARQRSLGKEHPDTLASMNHLSVAYRRMGQYNKATELQKQVLHVREQVLGNEHPYTLTTMSNLATSYGYQGHGEEAIKLHLKVFETRRRLLGETHPDVLTSMNNLGYAYLIQRRWGEASTILSQAFEKREQVLGGKHPNTLLTMSNLALAYVGQGRFDKAEDLHLQAYTERVQLHGINHPDTLMCLNHLAQTYSAQGRLGEAEELHLQTLEARKQVLGEEHPHTLTSMHNLAITLCSQGRWEECAKLRIDTIAARKRVLGEQHPETVDSMRNLA